MKRITKLYQGLMKLKFLKMENLIGIGSIIADAEAGFGGVLNAFEITRGYIEAGASGVHFKDQLASEKKCGHMGVKF